MSSLESNTYQINTSPKDRASLDFARSIRELARYQKIPYEQLWFLTSAMLLGRQYMKYDSIIGHFLNDDKAPSWRVRMTSNRMMPIYLRDLSRLTQGPAYFDVLPASDESEDRNKAEMSERLLEYLWQPGRLDIEAKRERMVSWALRTGIGILKVEWADEEGDLITEYEVENVVEMQEIYDDDGNPILDPITGEVQYEEVVTDETRIVRDDDGDPVVREQYRLGEISVRAITPFDFFVDDRYDDLQDAPFVMHYYVTRLDWLKKKYPKAKNIQPSTDVIKEKFYSERLRNLVSSVTSKTQDTGLTNFVSRSRKIMSGDQSVNESDGLVVVYEIWEKATKKYPYGRLLIVSEDVVLYDGRNPYNHARYPFVVFKEIPWQGRFWAMSTQEHLIPLQKSYNRSRSQEIEDANLTANPLILNFVGGRVLKSQLVNRPGGIVDVMMPGFEPRYLARNPSEYHQFRQIQQNALSDMAELSHQHSVTRGMGEKAGRSALGFAFLAEKDAMALFPKKRRLDRALEELARMILQLAHQYYKDTRLIKIAGESQEVEVMEFIGEELAGEDLNKDYFDVRIRPSTTAYVNKSAAKSEVLSYIQLGILHPQMDKRYIMRMLDIGNSKDFFLEDRLDEARAKKEIEILKKGDYVSAKPYENHIIHTEVFMRYMKSPEFYELSEDIQMAFMQHLQEHDQYIQAAIGSVVGPGGGVGQNIAGSNSASSPPKVGSKSKANEAIMTDQGGPQRNQKTSDLRGMYGGTAYGS